MYANYCLPLLAGLVILVYLPGLSGGFVFDDYQNVVLNQAVLIKELSWESLVRAAQSSGAGPGGRPVAQLSFALNHYFFGNLPWAFKAANVVLHLLNAFVIFLIGCRVLRHLVPDQEMQARRTYALLFAALWALHPLNVSTVLYVVQRMTVLSATFSLITVFLYLNFRPRLGALSWAAFISGITAMVASTMLGVFSKENAALTPWFVLLVEYLVFGFKHHDRRWQRVIRGIFLAAFLVPCVWFVSRVVGDSRWIVNMHAGRDYLLSDYLLTQARVLWFYLSSIFLPDLGRLGLYHDDFEMSHSLLEPATSALSLLGHLLLLCTAWLLRHRYRVISFGIAWFYVGHLLESTILPLILVFEHRNYLPLLGPLVVTAWVVGSLSVNDRFKRNLMIGWVAVLGLLSLVRANEWGNHMAFSLSQAEKHPQSARANFDAGRTLAVAVINHPELAAEYGPRAIAYFQRSADAPQKLPEPFLVAYQLASHVDVVVPGDFFSRLEKMLREEPPPNNVFYLFSALRTLPAGERRTLSIEQIKSLFEAAEENPRLIGKSRGHMLANFALFLREQGGDRARALSLAEEAVDQAPGFLDNRILAGWLALENGQTDKAKVYLAQAAEMDRFLVFSTEIAELRAQLYPDLVK